MQLSERIQVKRGTLLYEELDRACALSKNLYNATLYAVRQHFFKTGKYKPYAELNHDFISSRNPDYYALPTKVSQQTMRLVDQNFRSFFGLLKSKSKKARIPKYLEKNGREIAVFTIQAISKKGLENGVLKLSGMKTPIQLRESITYIQQVCIVPKRTFGCYEIEVIYEVNEKNEVEDNGRYASIDLGVNNLATVTFNYQRPFIVNGRPLKSINQFYNKKKSELPDLKSRKAKSLNLKRENKISDYLHKSSRAIVNHLVSSNASLLVIGKNDGWKQEAGLGRRNNQNFVSIPFEKFISMLTYKCALEGIKTVQVNESHTSKCSFLDNEEIRHHDSYVGRRIKRGLFRTKNGKLVNADVNGSLNILKKAVGEKAFKNASHPIEVCSTPVVFTPSK